MKVRIILARSVCTEFSRFWHPSKNVSFLLVQGRHFYMRVLSPVLGRKGFLGGSFIKNPPVNAGDTGDSGSVPGLGRSPGKGHGNPLQCSYLENPMDRGAWQATVHGVPKSWIQLKD